MLPTSISIDIPQPTSSDLEELYRAIEDKQLSPEPSFLVRTINNCNAMIETHSCAVAGFAIGGFIGVVGDIALRCMEGYYGVDTELYVPCWLPCGTAGAILGEAVMRILIYRSNNFYSQDVLNDSQDVSNDLPPAYTTIVLNDAEYEIPPPHYEELNLSDNELSDKSSTVNTVTV